MSECNIVVEQHSEVPPACLPTTMTPAALLPKYN